MCTSEAPIDTSSISRRTNRSFSQSSLIKHTSAIFDTEKLEAKVSMLLVLIQEAETSYKREKFDMETLQHLKERVSF